MVPCGFLIKKAFISVSNNNNINHFQLKTYDTSIISVDDHLLIIPLDSTIIYLNDNWKSTEEIGKKIFKNKTYDYRKQKCSIELISFLDNKWVLKITYRYFNMQYEIEEL